MNKFKRGNVVNIRIDLKAGETYNDVYFASNMKEYLGKQATITDLLGPHSYRIDIDGGSWTWSDDMFGNVDLISRFKKEGEFIFKSSVFGDVKVLDINEDNDDYPVIAKIIAFDEDIILTSDGKYNKDAVASIV